MQLLKFSRYTDFNARSPIFNRDIDIEPLDIRTIFEQSNFSDTF